MNLVSLSRLNELRFPQDPVTITKLQRWCRTDCLPGARKLGGEWYVDLDEFDRDAGVIVTGEKPNVANVVTLALDRMRARR